MCAAADRLTAIEAKDRAAAFACIGETLWWVVAVDHNPKQLPNGTQVLRSRTQSDAGSGTWAWPEEGPSSRTAYDCRRWVRRTLTSILG